MSDNSVDPSGNTEAFRAFTNTPQEPATTSRHSLIAGVAVLAVVVIALIVWAVI